MSKKNASILYRATLNISEVMTWGSKNGGRAKITNGAVLCGKPRWWMQFIPVEGMIFADGEVIDYVNDAPEGELSWVEQYTKEEGLGLMFQIGFNECTICAEDEVYTNLSRHEQDMVLPKLLVKYSSITVEWSEKWAFGSVDMTNQGNQALIVSILNAKVTFGSNIYRGTVVEVGSDEVDPITKQYIGRKPKGLAGVQQKLTRTQRKRSEKKEFYQALKEADKNVPTFSMDEVADLL